MRTQLHEVPSAQEGPGKVSCGCYGLIIISFQLLPFQFKNLLRLATFQVSGGPTEQAVCTWLGSSQDLSSSFPEKESSLPPPSPTPVLPRNPQEGPHLGTVWLSSPESRVCKPVTAWW